MKSHNTGLRQVVIKINETDRTVTVREYNKHGRVARTYKNVPWDDLNYNHPRH